MSDSSGRYTSQFFFGNEFWLGSRTECTELQNRKYNKFIPPFEVHFYVSRFLLTIENQNQTLVSLHTFLSYGCVAEMSNGRKYYNIVKIATPFHPFFFFFERVLTNFPKLNGHSMLITESRNDNRIMFAERMLYSRRVCYSRRRFQTIQDGESDAFDEGAKCSSCSWILFIICG